MPEKLEKQLKEPVKSGLNDNNLTDTDSLANVVVADNFSCNTPQQEIEIELLPEPIVGIKATKIFLKNLHYKDGDSIILAPNIQKPWKKPRNPNKPNKKEKEETYKTFWVLNVKEENGDIKPEYQTYQKRDYLTEDGKKVVNPNIKDYIGYVKQKDEHGDEIWFRTPIYLGGKRYESYSFEEYLPAFRLNPDLKTGLTCIPNKMKCGGEQFTATAKNWIASNSIYYELDLFCDFDLNLKVVTGLSKKLGLPPTMILHSGGKSPHVHLCFEPSKGITDEKVRLELQRMFCVLSHGDPAITNANREMRFPGVYRQEKGKEQSIVALTDKFYTEEEILDKTKKFFPYGITDIHWKEYLQFRKEYKREILENPTEYLKDAISIFQQTEEELKPKKPIRIKSDFNVRIKSETVIESSIAAPFEIFLGRETKRLIETGINQGEGGRDPKALSLSVDFQGRMKALDRLKIPYRDDAYSLIEDFCDNCNPPIPESAAKCWSNASKYAQEHPNIDDNFYLFKYRKWLEENHPEEVEKVFDAELKDAQKQLTTEEWVAQNKEIQQKNYRENKKFTPTVKINSRYFEYKKKTQYIQHGLFDDFCIVSGGDIETPPDNIHFFGKSGKGDGKSTYNKLVIETIRKHRPKERWFFLGYRNGLLEQQCEAWATKEEVNGYIRVIRKAKH